MTRFGPCACPMAKVTRIRRSTWMRVLFPSRSLYRCSSCGSEFLVTVAQAADLGQRAHAQRTRESTGMAEEKGTLDSNPSG